MAIACMLVMPFVIAAEQTPADSAPSAPLAKDKITVTVVGLDEPLKDNVEAFLQLVKLSESDQLLPKESRLRWLHEQAEQDIQNALQPFGYYRPEIQSSLELSATGDWLARYTIDAGPPLKITQMSVRVTGPGSEDPAFQRILDNLPLKPGAVLEHQKYEEIKQKLQAVATERGYFDARFKVSQIRIDLAAYQASIDQELASGQRYRYGTILFDQDTFSTELLQSYVRFKTGDPFFAPDLLKLQSELINSQYFDQVLIDSDPEQAEDFQIPITIQLVMRKRNKYTFGFGYGTDTGLRMRAGVERRWVNASGHRMDAIAILSQIRSTLSANYYIPSDDPRRNALKFGLQFETENSDVKDSTTGRMRIGRDVQWGNWTGDYGGEYLWEQFTVSNDEQSTQIVGFWTNLGRIKAKNRLRVINGNAMNISFYVSSDAILSDISFVQLAADSKWIWSFPSNNNSRLITRAEAATTWISDSDFEQLPTSFRYYAGGDDSIRGYGLDEVAPRDANGDVVGGRNLLVASLEYEYPLFNQWSIAAFVDTGDAFDGSSPEFKTGVGMGLRWQSPVGPIRVDLAHGLDNPDDTVRFYLNIGPDF